MKIAKIKARQILDSRGEPTVEADVYLENGSWGRAAVPSGASTGEHEAHEMRDGEKAFGGKGVQKAVAFVEGEIAEALVGMEAEDQRAIDQKMIDLDGTPNKSRLGANSILAVSLAVAKAAANAKSVQLFEHVNELAGKPTMSMPRPMFNVLNGGKHAPGSADFQEYMVIPKSAKTYSEAVQVGAEVFHALKKLISEAGNSIAVGDEGGFTYPVKSNTEMLNMLSIAAETAGYRLGEDVVFALDIASSEFFENGLYHLRCEDRTLDIIDLVDYLENIANDFPVVSIEDGLAQDEWSGWRELTVKLGRKLLLVGDDLLVTNSERLQRAIDEKAANAILIKPNQIGTLTETIDAVRLAYSNGFNTIISHRSGETEDTTIAHLAVGLGAGQIKTGSLSRSERNAKHNELMRIEELFPNIKIPA